MANIRIAGVIGRRPSATVVEIVNGREPWVLLIRQGVVALAVLGEIVRVIA